MIKTNAMRLLDAKKVHNVPHEYDAEITDGCAVADTLGEPRERVFKTLVTESGKGATSVYLHTAKSRRKPSKSLPAIQGEAHSSSLPVLHARQLPQLLVG